MKSIFKAVIVLALATGLVAMTPAFCWAEKATAPGVAVTVNGHDIMEEDVEKILDFSLKKTPSNKLQAGAQRERLRVRILESLIMNHLLASQAAKQNITASDKELTKALEEQFEKQIASHGSTREEYEKTMLKQRDLTWDELIARFVADPTVKAKYLHEKLIKHNFPEKIKVTDAQIRTFYDDNLKVSYEKPAQVRASHILIASKDAKTDEEKAALKKKAGDILVKAKKPGADFRALAAEFSACPTSNKGGDLGFFTKEKMVPSFSKAAFAMEKGQISDIVETNFGYHIIKVTDKKAPETVSFEQAGFSIRKILEGTKVREQLMIYIEELKDKAKIVYPKAAAAKK